MNFNESFRGLRNPKNSWSRSDSKFNVYYDIVRGDVTISELLKIHPSAYIHHKTPDGYFADIIGKNDMELAQKLIRAGSEHRKFMRQIFVSVDITAPLYWWKEFDTYKVGTVSNSCSTMHKIAEKEFTLGDFSHEHLHRDALNYLEQTIDLLNEIRDNYINYEEYAQRIRPDFFMSKNGIWWQMIQLLPSSYNQTRNVMMNYEVLANIYKSRKDHKLDEWVEFCRWIKTLPYQKLITGEDNISI